MKRRTRELIVVLFVLVGIGLAVFGFFWFSGRLRTGLRRNVTVYFDNVSGLRVGDPVEVMGIPKGRVAKVRLEGRRVCCQVALDQDVELTQDTRIAIRSVSYLGSDRYLMITLGPGPRAEDGFVFQGVNEALDLEETFLQLDRALNKFNPEELTGSLKQVAEDLMARIQGQLDHFSGQLDKFNSGLAVTGEELEGLSDGLDSLAVLLKGESTMGKLLTSQKLYDEVMKTNRQVQILIEDIKKNPKRYFKISIF